nr:hypothetical protein [Tanacetum cinerariifolium]
MMILSLGGGVTCVGDGERVCEDDVVCEVLLLEVDFEVSCGGERDSSLGVREGRLGMVIISEVGKVKRGGSSDTIEHVSTINRQMIFVTIVAKNILSNDNFRSFEIRTHFISVEQVRI